MADKKTRDVNELTRDKASRAAIRTAREEERELIWDRFDNQSPQCRFGKTGVCCRICNMGPCRIVPDSKRAIGACGADVDTVVARNFARIVAGGVAAHSDHARAVARAFLKTARGDQDCYEIRDQAKLREVAVHFGIEVDGREAKDIAIELGEAAVRQFGQQEGELMFIGRAPEARQKVWRNQGVVPRGIDREVTESMHRTTMGVDQDYRNILQHATRTALADGWGGSMMATELQDIMLGTPGEPYTEGSRQAVDFQANLGVLEEDAVNVVVHGHEPLVSEMVAVASRDPELVEYAREKGASGINVAGICCTANEVLIRHGIPVAGNFLQQELAISTGAVDAMLVDVQCIMQSLSKIASDYHTKIITTLEKARIVGAEHMEFDEDDALNSAKRIVRAAVDNYTNRRAVHIPEDFDEAIGGFSHEYIRYMLGGTFRSSYWPLNSNIIDGRIRGVAGVVGCNNASVSMDDTHIPLVEELIANDVLVVQTGCSAIASAKAGLMKPEVAIEKAGDGLAEVCEAVGIPPVLHAGSCVDNSRILVALTEMVNVGQVNSRLSLGDDISDLPVAGAAPEWMSEKAIAIGQYFVASGVFTVFGVSFPTVGSENVTNLLFEEYEELYGGKWGLAESPSEMAGMMIEHIEARRKALGIESGKERVLYDMEMRRGLDVE